MIKKLLFSVMLFSTIVNSQSLPDEMYISEDGKMLLSGKSNSSGFYDSAHIAEVNLQFANFNYWATLQIQ